MTHYQQQVHAQQTLIEEAKAANVEAMERFLKWLASIPILMKIEGGPSLVRIFLSTGKLNLEHQPVHAMKIGRFHPTLIMLLLADLAALIITMIGPTRPPQVDLVPARYIFFPNVPVKMRENSDNSDIR